MPSSTAALSYLMLGQGDSVGLGVFDNTIRRFIPPRLREDHWGTLMENMVAVQSTREESAIATVLSELGEYIKKRGVIIVISDLVDDPEAVLKNLAILTRRQQEIILFHVLTPEEIDLPYSGTVDFHSLEGEDNHLLTTPKRLRRSYQEKIAKFLESYRNGCLERGIDYTLVRTDQPLENVLREYLQQRLKISSRK